MAADQYPKDAGSRSDHIYLFTVECEEPVCSQGEWGPNTGSPVLRVERSHHQIQLPNEKSGTHSKQPDATKIQGILVGRCLERILGCTDVPPTRIQNRVLMLLWPVLLPPGGAGFVWGTTYIRAIERLHGRAYPIAKCRTRWL